MSTLVGGGVKTAPFQGNLWSTSTISHPRILDPPGQAKCWPLCDFLPIIIFILIANPLGTTKEPAFSLKYLKIFGGLIPDQLIRPPLLDILPCCNILLFYAHMH